MKKWITIDGFGNLYKEIILVMFDVPVLFVCKDENDDRWLALCEDEETGEYLLAKCQKEELLKMISRINPVDEVIKNAKIFTYISYDFGKGQFLAKKIQNDEITEEMLPDKGTYLYVNDKIREYEKKLLEEGFCVRVKNRKRVAGNFVKRSISAHAETVLRPYVNTEDYNSNRSMSFHKSYKDTNNFTYVIGHNFVKKGEVKCKIGVN